MVAALMVSVTSLTPIYAQVIPIIQYEIKQQPSGEVEIIIPGRIKDVDKATPKSEEEQAIADARRDVKAHVNKTLWFTTGCFLPIFGPMRSQRDINTTDIPAARTLGKSPQYVAFYIDAYKIEMKKTRYNWALTGCIVGGLTDACLVGLFLNYYLD